MKNKTVPSAIQGILRVLSAFLALCVLACLLSSLLGDGAAAESGAKMSIANQKASAAYTGTGGPFFNPAPTPTPKPTAKAAQGSSSSEHFALKARGWGPCDKLTGDAYIILVFVSTPQHPWTKKVKDRVNNVSWSSIDIMEKEARRYGAKLDLQFGGLDYSVPYEYNRDLKWYHYIIEEIFHEESIKEVYSYYRKSLHVDTVSMIFLFNSWDTSHTYMTSSDYPHWNEEFCVIFCDTNMHDNYLTHEVLHLYGAIDLYDYNNEGVQRVAKKYFPNSDMLTVSHNIDELTAYLVGWTNTLSKKANAFLAETKGLR